MTGTPVGIQIRRVRGFKLQAESLARNGLPARSVTRSGFLAGLFGNPFQVAVFGRERAVALHRAWLTEEQPDLSGLGYGAMQLAGFMKQRELVLRNARLLAGLNLGCRCPEPASGEPDLCHRSVLLELANAFPSSLGRPA